jgi:hypothetical protein
MACLQASLQTAFRKMAQGSQADSITVIAAATHIYAAYTSLMSVQGSSRNAALQPHLRDLLQAAGWLYPCVLPSSSLHVRVQLGALQSWQACMVLALECLAQQPVADMAAFLRLAKARARPQVPGWC